VYFRKEDTHILHKLHISRVLHISKKF